jgi:hypothetical protein
MPRITYYARIDATHPADRPAGIVRRIHTEPVPTDEAFTRNMRWEPTEYLRRYYLGHNDDDHVEISEQEANRIIQSWRERFAAS